MDAPTPIPLKFKHRRPKPKGKFKTNYGGNNSKAKTHRTLTPAEIALHAAQPKMIRVMLPSGKTRLIREQDYGKAAA